MGEGLVMKKVFSMILALCFCVSCIHFSAFADEDYPNPDTIDDAMYMILKVQMKYDKIISRMLI